jgi:hypothetical protein
MTYEVSLRALKRITRDRSASNSLRRAFAPTLTAAACCALLCVLFALDVSMVGAAVRERHNALPERLLPIATIQPGAMYLGDIDSTSAMKIEVIRIAEVFVLGAFGLLLGAKRLRTNVFASLVVGTALTMGYLAIEDRVSESADMYAYVGLAQAVPSAYHPGATPFSGDEAVINRLWGLPLVPSAYGPLWVAISKAATAPATTLAGKLITLRLLGLAAFAICIGVLWSLGSPRGVLALFAVNPAVYELFVTQAHNDLIGVAFILLAALARPRSRVAALILCAAAGAIKLPLILVAMLVFASEATPAGRVRLALVSAAMSLAISLTWAGPSYIWALLRVSELEGVPGSPLQLAFHAIIALFAIAAILTTVIRGWFVPGSPWLMPALGRTPLPHYLGWSLPVVFLDPTPKWAFLATMPLVAFLLDSAYPATPLKIAVLVALGLAALIYAFVLTRRRTNRLTP